MSELQAGVYRVDITPPVGISMVGYYARKGVSEGIERPLTATACVLPKLKRASDNVTQVKFPEWTPDEAMSSGVGCRDKAGIPDCSVKLRPECGAAAQRPENFLPSVSACYAASRQL